MEQLDAAEQCKYAKKTVKKRLLERVRAPNSASFRTSSQMVQREWHSHGVHWTAATGRTLLSATSVVRRLRTDEIMGVPKVARTDSVVPQILFGSFVAKRETNISATESARFVFREAKNERECHRVSCFLVLSLKLFFCSFTSPDINLFRLVCLA